MQSRRPNSLQGSNSIALSILLSTSRTKMVEWAAESPVLRASDLNRYQPKYEAGCDNSDDNVTMIEGEELGEGVVGLGNDGLGKSPG